MELAETVKCLLCRGRQPFDKRCFDEMEIHLRSQHRVTFFLTELIQYTKDAKIKEEILADQTIDVDMEVKQLDQGDIIVEYEHVSSNEETVDEDGDSILVDDNDITTNEPEYSTDSLMEADVFVNEVLEGFPVASEQDSCDVPACVNKPEIYNENRAAINFNPDIVDTILEERPIDVAVSYDVNNTVDIIDEYLVQLNTAFPIVNERNEDLAELLRNTLDAFVDTSTRIIELTHKPSESIDTLLPPPDSKASLEMSKGSAKLSSDLFESPHKSKEWYDLVPRGNDTKLHQSIQASDLPKKSKLQQNVQISELHKNSKQQQNVQPAKVAKTNMGTEEFGPGDLVLVNFPGSGYWPCQITRVRSKNWRDVVYFGALEVGKAHVLVIRAYDKVVNNSLEKYISKRKMAKDPMLRLAVHQINKKFTGMC